MIGKIKVSKKASRSPDQYRGKEAVTSPSFALFEVNGANKVISTALSGRRKKLLQENKDDRGTTPQSRESNPPIIAIKSSAVRG